jgi:hypothetical protein
MCWLGMEGYPKSVFRGLFEAQCLGQSVGLTPSTSLIATLLWDQTDSPPLELALLSLGSLPPVFFQP